MKFNKYLICALFLVLICCIGAASAADTGDDVVAVNDTIDEAVSETVDVSDEIDEDSLGVSEEPALSEGVNENSDEGYVIYVGQNISEDGGNGSYENPFSTLDLACNDINGKNVATINVFKGTYNISNLMNINASKIKIQSIDGVAIFNYSMQSTNTRSFILNNELSNLTFNNIVFDGSDETKSRIILLLTKKTNHVEFNNCTFNLGNRLDISVGSGSAYKNYYNPTYKFFNCKFESLTKTSSPIGFKTREISDAYFDYCIFNLPSLTTRFFPIYVNTSSNEMVNNVVYINSWFGSNLKPSYLSLSATDVTTWRSISNYELITGRFAMFSVSENYLGNNQFEIIGKLTWNGTEDQDGMENFQPMTVKLSSTTGDINETAFLTNGTFRAIYTSSNSTHKVSATLDYEEIELNFNTTDIILEPVSIYYGEHQNITFNFTQLITANVTVTVSNATYNKSQKVEVINKDSITYSIPDTLKAGTYNVEISLAENNLFGSNTTTFTVLKVSEYTFNIDIQDNGDIKAGDDVTITVELPSDVSGNVTVKVNDNPEITKEATPNTVITINNLVGGNNNITISYNGNDKYAAKTSEPQVITAQKASVPGGENILNVTTPANSATPTFTINLPNATGNLTVIVDGKDKYTKALENGSATITVPELSAGKHDIIVTYSGDAKYESISKNTTVNVPAKTTPSKTPVVKKAATKITAKKKTFKAKTKVKKYTITLKSGKKPVKKVQVTIKIGKKTFKAKTNAKGKATFKIKKLTKKGKYTAVIKFKGNKNYKATTKKVKITIKK